MPIACLENIVPMINSNDVSGLVVLDFAVGGVRETNVFCHEMGLSWTRETSDAVD